MSPITLTLDGVVLDTTRTPLKSAPALPGHYLHEGRIMGPDELSVGSHVLKGDVGNPGFPFHDQITFVIDAPGTGTCS